MHGKAAWGAAMKQGCFIVKPGVVLILNRANWDERDARQSREGSGKILGEISMNFSWLPGFQIKESVSHLRKSGPRASVDKLYGFAAPRAIRIVRYSKA
jgi:hypothetical protein